MLVTIIIITLNEADNIEKTIRQARLAAQFPSGKTVPIEIIVSDGGSTDDTLKIARKFADKVITGTRGRYLQLNKGAEESRGDILIFLHADTLLPEGAIIRILSKLRDPDVIGGGFKKYWNWDPNVQFSKLVKFGAYWWQGLDSWLVRLLRTFPGDNAVFVRRSIFEKIKGFRPMWICEDFDFSYRLIKYGKKKFVYIRSAVLTSTRRFERYGFFKLVFTWMRIFWFWRLGMSQNQLKAKFSSYKTLPERGNRNYLRF
ncbi:MAG: TIGR04283 family arsenosugar biosynthesis glycosyltransferase [Promethearchaeota archaeon]|jgi:glycosyltransferase involved in cell wall biosynthesis